MQAYLHVARSIEYESLRSKLRMSVDNEDIIWMWQGYNFFISQRLIPINDSFKMASADYQSKFSLYNKKYNKKFNITSRIS